MAGHEPRSWLRADLVLGVGAIALAVGGYFLIAHLPVGSGSRPGSGAMPRILLALIGGLGGLIILGDLRRPSPALSISLSRPVLAISACLLVFALMIRPAGLVAAAFVTAFIATLATDEIGWGTRIVASAILSGLASFLFTQLLGLPIRLWP